MSAPGIKLNRCICRSNPFFRHRRSYKLQNSPGIHRPGLIPPGTITQPVGGILIRLFWQEVSRSFATGELVTRQGKACAVLYRFVTSETAYGFEPPPLTGCHEVSAHYATGAHLSPVTQGNGRLSRGGRVKTKYPRASPLAVTGLSMQPLFVCQDSAEEQRAFNFWGWRAEAMNPTLARLSWAASWIRIGGW